MTPTELRVARQLHELADVPVTAQDVERAHAEFLVRLRELPGRRTSPSLVTAVAVALVVLLAAAWWLSSGHKGGVEPAQRPAHASEVLAHRAAAGFVGAFTAFDVPRARAWLARGAVISGELADGWPALDRYFAATGSELIPGRCRVVGSTTEGTRFRCPFRYYALRSKQLGRGPYRGSWFDIVAQGGRVRLALMHFEYLNGFNAEMWSPFAAWINRTHPRDAAVMYTNWPLDNQWRLTDRSIRLWSQRTRDYIRQMTATAAPSPPGVSQ